jgi:cell wall-associated NlpC family hydrolase
MRFFYPLMRATSLVTLAGGVALGLSGCGSAPVQPAPTASAVDISSFTPVAGRLTPEQATDVVLSAMGLIGTPYRYGGNTPESGFDCSGLIGYVYQTRASVKPPRTTAELTFWGRPVEQPQLRSGDLVLFGKSTVASHAGIYVGEGRFVHAPSTGGTVRMDRLDSRYWAAQQPRFKRP